ncbi:MAG: ABC transporter substrate-binding protein [Candidatus Accumulibacter sp.]|jgi:peptide/nickel transport system substrate-binding protein|nr:ABC transporter substrate-binding protein [Accumulibacter sp.]
MVIDWKHFLLHGFAPILVLAIGAGASLAAEPKSGGTLVLGTTQVLRHFNGAVQSGSSTGYASTQIFASPLRYDDKWNPQPYLAESWKISPDGKSVTLHLVKNALFHDGVPVTSKDVAFSIDVIKKNHPFQPMLAPVETVETPDEHTAILRLSHPHPAILRAMSPGLMPILPKHIYDTGEDLKTHPANLKPVGSGPYKFVEYKQGDYYVLEKFDKFFIPGRPYLDKIVVRTLPDDNSLLLELERKNIHVLSFISNAASIQRLESLKDIVLTDRGYEGIGATSLLEFNTQAKPVNDVRVRQAIAYAVDRDFFLKNILRGRAKPLYGPIAVGSPFYTDKVEQFKVDLKKANALLDAAGYPQGKDGVRFALAVDNTPGYDRVIADYLRPQLKKIGIAVEVRTSADLPAWAKRVSNFDYQITVDSLFNWGDPVIGVARTFLTSNIRQGVIWSNNAQYANPRVDELLARAAVENDHVKRKAIYDEFQGIVVNEVPTFFISSIPHHSAFVNGLGNLPLTIWGLMSPLDEVYWETPLKQ